MKYFSRLFSYQLVFKGDGIPEATAEDSLQETELRAKKRQGRKFVFNFNYLLKPFLDNE